jgi:hypothetical protein
MPLEDTLSDSISHAWQLALRLYGASLGTNHAATAEALKQMVELLKLRKALAESKG